MRTNEPNVYSLGDGPVYRFISEDIYRWFAWNAHRDASTLTDREKVIAHANARLLPDRLQQWLDEHGEVANVS